MICRNKLFRLISSNGLSIYIYSNPPNYLITHLAVSRVGILIYAGEGSVAMLLAIKMIIGVLVLIDIGYIMKRLRFKYLC